MSYDFVLLLSTNLFDYFSRLLYRLLLEMPFFNRLLVTLIANDYFPQVTNFHATSKLFITNCVYDFFLRLLVRHHQRDCCNFGDCHSRNLLCASHHEKISCPVHSEVKSKFCFNSFSFNSYFILCSIIKIYSILYASHCENIIFLYIQT